MTFSVVARCERTGQFGVAAATAMAAVGKLASHATAHYGAVATQAVLNPYFGYDGLRLLEQGCDAQQTLDKLIAQDPEPQKRQAGVVDRNGSTAAWTGKETADWSGDLSEQDFSTQGNRLAGPQVLEAVAKVMRETEDQELAERLLLALEAGVAEGGDTKGERSANIFVFHEEEYPLWDIRVDDHDEPLKELRRLFDVFRTELLPQFERMPTRREFPRVSP